uniref:Uncharacterized protein n=1 Tax=Oryza rufipogon TaxID=4529 RepID=A0A0E0PK89_ORYRU
MPPPARHCADVHPIMPLLLAADPLAMASFFLHHHLSRFASCFNTPCPHCCIGGVFASASKHSLTRGFHLFLIFAPTIMRRDQYTILRRCCREVEMRPRGSHVCR